MTLSPQQLGELLEVNFATGELRHKFRTPDMFEATNEHTAEDLCKWWNEDYAGKPALTGNYAVGGLGGTLLDKRYSASRVVYAMFYGQWPHRIPIYRNGNKQDNRISNLEKSDKPDQKFFDGADHLTK
tara:strand:+ start:790 stop:1173 length:384 start_codon:yes stop_codon:yes gene_type:complete